MKYSILVKIGSDVYRSKGDSMLEALENLPQPVKIFQKGILTISTEDKSVDRVLMPMRLKRLWYKISQPVLAKNFEFLLA